MNDFFDIFSILFVISLAVALGFFVKWIYLLLRNQTWNSTAISHSARHCMEAACVFLSLGIACFAIILIGSPWQSLLQSFNIEDIFYYSVIFLSIFIFVVFFRVLAPVFLGIYVLYCLVFVFLFFHSYSALPEDFSVTALEQGYVEFQEISLSYKNLLPLPRYWVSNPRSVIQEDRGLSFKPKLFEQTIDSFGENSGVSKIVIMLTSLILEKDIRINTVRIDINPLETTSNNINYSVFVQDSHVVYERY